MNERLLRVAMILADEREERKKHSVPRPYFGMAPAALLEGMKDLPGLELHIVSCERAPVAHTPRLAENFYFHPVRTSRWGFLRSFYLESSWRIRALVQRIGADLAHGQGTERYQALGAVFSGKPSLVTIHGNMRAIKRELRYPLLSFYGATACLENVALRKAGGVLCNSRYTRNEVASVARRMWDAPNALASEYFAPLPAAREEIPRILSVGHVQPLKNQVELLEAARRLFAQGLKFRLEFIGGLVPVKGYDRRFHELLIAAEKEGWARYLGRLDMADVIREMNGARGFIHVPRQEAFGLVVAESIARGLKSFVFGVGGVSDIAAGVAGVEVFPPNDWTGLLDAVGGWIRAGAPVSAEGSTVMRERYSPETIARRHLTIYRELLAEPER